MSVGAFFSKLTSPIRAQGSVNRRIFKSTVLIAVLTLVVRCVGLAREMAIAANFGTSDQVDAYIVAFLLPSSLVTILAGSLNAAFIPTFVSVRENQGPVAANRLLGNVVLCTVALLTVMWLTLLGLAPLLLARLAPSFDAEKLTLALRLFYWLSPTIIVQGVIIIWSSVMNAAEDFALAAMLPSIATVVALLFLLMAGQELGIYSLAIGYTVGFIMQAAVLGWQLRRVGCEIRPRWQGWTPELRQVVGQYLPMVAGSFLMTGTSLVETFMAAALPAGSVASLGYASRLIAVANGICATALGTAVLPHFSAMVARADWAGIAHTLKTYRWLIVVAGGIASLLLVGTSNWIVALLYHRGEFSMEAAAIVSELQKLYAIQLPFYAGGIFLVRLISALQANRFLMWGSLASLIVNIALNLLLRDHLGLSGIALTNSLMYVLSFFYLAGVSAHQLRKRLREAKLGVAA